MNFKIANLLNEIEIIKGKFEDLLTTFMWFEQEYFTHDSDHQLNKEELKIHGYKYHEHRIQINQAIDLMQMYTKELEKALSDESLATESDNA
ncbi:type II toxin-antitoxin system toxin TscT [Staphylococcus simulans]|uniref:type II toxin-antitoxin system toxin TscT n=1 Tax=Staphylococcus simulans TaxID=1286 RepID=UPI000D02DAFA|nr:DUF1474 family protein [Staphylococcus simulans]AVO02817.1 pathogenicity island protein [Staphylococcus simulans]AVO05763.1 pathogenicity island protein [Staphylococcus simulans]AWG19365.1 pathogenicity island protein [Staphylococcus simulans]AWI02314.1 pathogenicity island protein [Staphylococcus simulans]PTI91939.1 DUF1474 domain-containing protein [Staphylococcus simulans]